MTERPKLGPLGVEHEATYVIGFPMYAAIAIKGEGGAGFRRLPPITWTASGASALGVRVRHGGATIRTVEPDAADVSPTDDRPSGGLVVPAGGETRALVDIHFYLRKLAPGDYSVELSYGSETRKAHGKAFATKLRAPTAEEARDLAMVLSEMQKADEWGWWTEAYPVNEATVTLPRGTRDPLRWNKMIRHLMFGPETETMDLAALDVLDGLFAPEHDALLAEVLYLRDPAAGRRAAADAKAKHPGMWEWMDDVADGRGTIKFYREKWLKHRALKRTPP